MTGRAVNESGEQEAAMDKIEGLRYEFSQLKSIDITAKEEHERIINIIRIFNNVTREIMKLPRTPENMRPKTHVGDIFCEADVVNILVTYWMDRDSPPTDGNLTNFAKNRDLTRVATLFLNLSEASVNFSTALDKAPGVF